MVIYDLHVTAGMASPRERDLVIYQLASDDNGIPLKDYTINKDVPVFTTYPARVNTWSSARTGWRIYPHHGTRTLPVSSSWYNVRTVDFLHKHHFETHSGKSTIFSLPIINTRYNSRTRPGTYTSNKLGRSTPQSRGLSSYSSNKVSECGCTHGRLLYRTDGLSSMSLPAIPRTSWISGSRRHNCYLRTVVHARQSEWHTFKGHYLLDLRHEKTMTCIADLQYTLAQKSSSVKCRLHIKKILFKARIYMKDLVHIKDTKLFYKVRLVSIQHVSSFITRFSVSFRCPQFYQPKQHQRTRNLYIYVCRITLLLLINIIMLVQFIILAPG